MKLCIDYLHVVSSISNVHKTNVDIVLIWQDGWSALMIAARYGHPSTCVALLGNDRYTALNNVDKVSNCIT